LIEKVKEVFAQFLIRFIIPEFMVNYTGLLVGNCYDSSLFASAGGYTMVEGF
jgi:hypothetical protein